MVCTKSLCLSFLVVLVSFLALPRLADEEPINSRSTGKGMKFMRTSLSTTLVEKCRHNVSVHIDSSYSEDSHVVLTNPLQVRTFVIYETFRIVFVLVLFKCWV